VGLLSRIVEGNRYEVVQAVTPDNSIARGQTFEFGQTYCDEMLRTDATICFEHAAMSSGVLTGMPVFTAETHLGVRIEAGGQVYGALDFMGASRARLASPKLTRACSSSWRNGSAA